MALSTQRWCLIPLIVLGLILLCPWNARAEELRLSVAGSMADVITELGTVFTSLHPHIRLLPNVASSGALAKQMAAGAPADIFISANPEWMDFVVAQGLVASTTVRPLVANRLVVVGPPKVKARHLIDLPGLQRIALGSPESVPAGRYAQQALIEAGLYESLRAAEKLVLAKDVRQALLYADRGEVDAAFVYATDARLAGRAQILFEIPQALYPPIIYPLGLTVTGQSKDSALIFKDFLFGDAAKAIFSRHGFYLVD